MDDYELCDPNYFKYTVHPDPVAAYRKHTKCKKLIEKLKPKIPNPCLHPPLTVRGAIAPLEKKFEKEPICYCDPNSRPPRPPKPPRPEPEVTSQIVRLPSPMDVRINDMIPRVRSPELIGPKVKPRRPSDSSLMPEFESELDLHKPKSGIVIKDSTGTTLIDLMSIGYDRPYAIDFIRKYGLFDYLSLGLEQEELTPEALQLIVEALEDQGEGAEDVQFEIEVETASQRSAEVQTEPEIEEEKEPSIASTIEPPEKVTAWVQKFRDESDAKKYEASEIYFKRKTLESHSYTDIKQPIVKEYKYGIKLGTYDQSDTHFSERTRDKQTLANLIVSYCFSFIKHPCQWTSQDIDDVLEDGDKLFHSTLDFLHFHNDQLQVKASDLLTKVIVGDKKFIYRISEPLYVGLTKSDDKSVFNLTKAFTVFFKRYKCALLITPSLQLIVWKCRYYYLFDPKPRAKDLYPDPTGAAAIISFFDIKTIVSMLIERTVMKNWRFTLHNVCILKILDVDAPYDIGDSLTSGFAEANEYRILNENKAVINASLSMADPCFDWMANKQMLTMCVIALVYTKITPPAAWSRKILDKVLILGNTLYYEIAVEKDTDDVNLDNIPGEFTLGPYRVTINILLSVIKGYMFSRKKYPSLELGIDRFFDYSTAGIVQFSKFCYAVCKQRGFYYMFDPFPRDYEGYQKREGTAIFTMHNSLDSLKETLMMNVDQEDNCVFSIHALKEVRVCVGGDDIRPSRLEGALDRLRAKMPISQIKPICIHMTSLAVEDFVPNSIPSQSDISISSSVNTLDEEYVPHLTHDHSMPSPKPTCKASKISLGVCDLDSPSLSDTQIVPPRPDPCDREELSHISDEVFSMTSMLDLLVPPEEQPHGGDLYIELYDFEKRMIDELEMWCYEHEGLYEMEEVRYRYKDLGPRTMSAMTMTEGFRRLKRKILHPPHLPPSAYQKRPLIIRPLPKEIPQITLSKELLIDTNFIPMPDGSEIIVGNDALTNYPENQVSFMAPFVAIMAIVVAHKYAHVSWDQSVLDYIIQCGKALHEITPQRFDEAAVHEFLRIVLGSTDFKAKSTYILDSVFKQSIMEQILNTLFKRCSRAIIVNPSYSCAIFFKNHLYYLYDPYNSNSAGIGQGENGIGYCTFARFTSCHQMVARILHNKSKREENAGYHTTRYVLSVVECHSIPPAEDENLIEEPMPDQEKIAIEEGCKKVPIEQPQTIGYQLVNNQWMILGKSRLRGRNAVVENCIKECHFASLCALLLLIYHPIDSWDSKLVDKSLKLGLDIFKYAYHKELYEKRIVNNIFLERKFFDVIIALLEFPLMMPNQQMAPLLDYYLRKRNFLMLQFPPMCMALYVDDKYHHLFDPYKYKHDKARWMRFESRKELVDYINTHVAGARYCTYYTFCVTSLRSAPKKITLATTLTQYQKQQKRFREQIIVGKPFYEKEEWMDTDPIPWSRLETKNAGGQLRGEPETMWKEWDIEHPHDLWSLWGNLHQKSSCFQPEARGKQTLCNCVVCLLITIVYDFSEWNPIILDSILKDGNQYYVLSVRDLSDEEKNNEFNIEHLKSEILVPPFTATVTSAPVVEGTMYVVLSYQFNLYKALAFFFNKVERRLGIIFATASPHLPSQKRILAFGKVREKEYFMFDCQSYGPPLFLEKQGCSYILRMNSLNRLVHSMALTIRDGDFYIYEVVFSDLKETKNEDLSKKT